MKASIIIKEYSVNILFIIGTYLLLTSPKLFFNSNEIELISSEIYYNEISLFFAALIILSSQFITNFSGFIYCTLLLISIFLRYLEIFHYKLFGFGFEPISFSHFNEESIGLLLETYQFEIISTSILLVIFLILSQKIRIKRSYLLIILSTILVIRGLILINKWGGLKFSSINRIYSSEISLLNAYIRYNKSFNFNINKEEINLINQLHSDNTNTLVHKRNIFLIYLESFSHSYLNKKLTPKLYKFSDESLVSSNYFNSVTPTINAIISSQCGIFPQLGYGERANYKANVERYNSLTCLGDILEENGYHLRYIQAANKEFSSKGLFLKNHGFEIVYGREEISRNYSDISKQETNFWGISDRQLFEIANQELSKLKDKIPFLFSLITINTHSPGYFSQKCPIIEEKQILKSIMCTDHYLGIYLENIKKEFPESIIIITGDHVAGPNNEARRLMKDQYIQSAYDRTLLIIHDPDINENTINSVLGSTPDVYPTIIELLGGDDLHINFGKSLLSKRISNQNIIPEFQLNEYQSDFPKGIFAIPCFDEKPILNDRIHNCTRNRIFNYVEKNFYPLN